MPPTSGNMVSTAHVGGTGGEPQGGPHWESGGRPICKAKTFPELCLMKGRPRRKKSHSSKQENKETLNLVRREKTTQPEDLVSSCPGMGVTINSWQKYINPPGMRNCVLNDSMNS